LKILQFLILAIIFSKIEIVPLDTLNDINNARFDLPVEALDTLRYTAWKDRIVSIDNFSWTVKPTYYDAYLLRGDLILLSMLKENKFRRDLFFTRGIITSQLFGLEKQVTPLVLVDKLSVSAKTSLSFEDYIKTIV